MRLREREKGGGSLSSKDVLMLHNLLLLKPCFLSVNKPNQDFALEISFLSKTDLLLANNKKVR